MLDENKPIDSLHGETKILVDYFCFTVSVDNFLDYDSTDYDGRNIPGRMDRKFFLQNIEWQERRGMYGYSFAKYYDGIVFAWGGNNTVYVQMSGTGCRTWESLHPGLTWEKWIAYLQSTYASLHISRLDIACDTFGLLQLKKIQAFTRCEHYISRWKTYLIQEGSAEMAVIWGSPKSDFRLRIYDKTLERIVKGCVNADSVPKDWVRCEFQLRNDAAASFINSWLVNGSIGGTFFGIMRNQLNYVTSYDGKNRDRAILARWWSKLLGDADRIKMSYNGGKEYNFEKLKRYIFRMVGPSLKTYLSIVDGDMDVLMNGIDACRLNDRQQDLIKTCRPELRQKQLDLIAMHDAYKKMMQDVGRVGNGGEASIE